MTNFRQGWRKDMSLVERLARMTAVSKGGCHLWLGAIGSGGYGTITVGGRKLRAHRMAWEVVNGPIPKGLVACHRCDNPKCVNPEHIFIGTRSDNSQDMLRKGRNYPVRGSLDGMAKLTEKDIHVIRKRLAAGESDSSIGRIYNVHGGTIGKIKLGSTWGHVK